MAPKEEDRLLKCGEPVRFGLLTSLFRLKSSRLVICSSGLSTSDSALVKTTIESLSGKKPDSETIFLVFNQQCQLAKNEVTDEKTEQSDMMLKYVCL